MSSKRKKTTDEIGETVHGISQEEAQRIYKEQLRRGKHIIGLTEEEIKVEIGGTPRDDIGTTGCSAPDQVPDPPDEDRGRAQRP